MRLKELYRNPFLPRRVWKRYPWKTVTRSKEKILTISCMNGARPDKKCRKYKATALYVPTQHLCPVFLWLSPRQLLSLKQKQRASVFLNSITADCLLLVRGKACFEKIISPPVPDMRTIILDFFLRIHNNISNGVLPILPATDGEHSESVETKKGFVFFSMGSWKRA